MSKQELIEQGWAIIEEFPDYRVTVDGRVLTKSRAGWREMCPVKHAQGYLFVGLRKNKRRTTRFIHRLVCTAFLDNQDSKPQVNHKDGNQSNNRLENLEWVTCKENINHAINTGLRRQNGSDNWYSKLNEKDIPEIKRMLKDGKTHREIAENFNVTISTISKVKLGRSWTHVAA